jgi:hypothetical protein
MASAAKALGAVIVDKEGALDRHFSERTITTDQLRAMSSEIGGLRGQLRAVHLEAHLETTTVLTPQQVHRYDVLRRYTQTRRDDLGAPTSGHHRKH